MLGRRQIREKVIEMVYSYYQNPLNTDVLEKNMFSNIDKIYHLYIHQLNFLVALKRVAEDQMEIGKKKFLKTDNEIHPNQKFVQNKILKKIEENADRKAYSAKHKELTWDLHDDFLVRTFQRIISGKRYQDFMAIKDWSFDEDQKFVGKLFLRYMAENDDFHDYVVDKELSWEDGMHIANSMVQKTIGFFKNDEDSQPLIKMIKDEQDVAFASDLLRTSLNNWEVHEKKISDRLENWNLERIGLMDKVILVVAITELDHFKLTPSRVIINEYIEISKVYATEKSNIFINGILDKYTKEHNRI